MILHFICKVRYLNNVVVLYNSMWNPWHEMLKEFVFQEDRQWEVLYKTHPACACMRACVCVYEMECLSVLFKSFDHRFKVDILQRSYQWLHLVSVITLSKTKFLIKFLWWILMSENLFLYFFFFALSHTYSFTNIC